MPPARNVNHAIRLKERTEPINVRLYKYPYIKKNEIERLVREMLAEASYNPS